MHKGGRSFFHHGVMILLFAGFLSPISAFAQDPSWLDVWPDVIYTPPGEPSCSTVTVGDGAYMTLDLEVATPWGYEYFFGWPTLDENGQASVCADQLTPGHYEVTGVRNSQYWWAAFTPVWSTLDVIDLPPTPPAIGSAGPGCDNWDCIWAVGSHFKPDSQVVVYSANWAYHETYYGPAWQSWPPLNVSGDGQSLSFQLADPNLRYAFGWDGVYILVVNNDGTSSSWTWVKAPAPAIYSATPSCSDSYCITFSGSFPPNAFVDFRIPGEPDVRYGVYTDLVVTTSQITLRLNPGIRYAFDTTGLNAWVVNPALPNWSLAYYIAPVDRSVKGWFSGISQQGSEYYLYGWACANTYPGSIDIHVYAGGAHVLTGAANAPSEPGVAEACNSTGANYRFWLQIPPAVIQQHLGQQIYIYGISPFGLSNLPLNRAGDFSVPGVLALHHREYIYIGGRLLAVDAQ